ncbi:serine/threonine-protein kinase-like protein CCR1 [Chenopodium quinoa]|uniref:non-specific serine/threonine protein kinase n=1 Tax=Chenopodium quinoa TaxID=63459 RepID=A0A803N4P9_CHEQI|nr:serine/threonine-protein kinase-like protein CCR1 [Chenopodium quinoa]
MLSLSSILLFFSSISITAYGFGSMGPISAAFGRDDSFFCAIDASGKQAVICWGMSPEMTSENFTTIPPMAALSGGEGFMCGILANTSQAYCWDSYGTGNDLVPPFYRYNNYSFIAAGKNHVCAIKGNYYSGTSNSGSVDCWEVVHGSNSSTLTSKQSTLFYDQSIDSLLFVKIVSGDGFSCGVVKDDEELFCWGPSSTNIRVSKISENFLGLSSSRSSVCGIVKPSGEVKCWGKDDSNSDPPSGVRFVALTGGSRHFCGIRADTHGVDCWGGFNASSIPKRSGFFAIATSDIAACGIREEDLVLDCWFINESTAPPEYNPPLQLCSPGLCSPRSCDVGEFAFNASALNEPELTNVCIRKDLHICSSCGTNCSSGYFLSSPCTDNADRECTACSLCQNSSCWGVCGLAEVELKKRHQRQMQKIVLILGPSIAGFLLILIGWCLFPYLYFFKAKDGPTKQFRSCIGKKDPECDANGDPNPPIPIAHCPEEAQIFRLSELKDATNGFKEFNELGRGSYGFVYKALLPDGRQVAVKRANAATIIHTNIREFENELEILCKLRHCNIVNLLGYCTEMGERLLVYEYMTHGTLHDHLHNGLSPLSWTFRLRIAMQAAKGLEYLHMEANPPVVHRDVKTSNILLDTDWGARISDFGCLNFNEKDLGEDMKNDVFNFGVVLLEILSGRKAYDVDYSPPNIVEWAVPLIRRGKAAALIDRYVALPRNVEPLLKLADIAESAVRENSSDRPTMSAIANSLEQIVKEGLIL